MQISSPDSDQAFFSMEEVSLWIMYLYFSRKQQFEVKNILMIDLFLINTQMLVSRDIN